MKIRKIGTAALLGAALILAPGELSKAAEDVIVNGVYIGDVNVSGMTKEEAEKAVEEKLGKGTGGNYTVKIGEETIGATAEDFGMSWENREVVEEALATGKSGNIIKRYKDKKDLEQEPKKFEVSYAPVEEKVRSFVNGIAAEYNQEAVEGEITFSNGYPEVSGGSDGIAVNVEASVTSLIDGLNGDGTELTITADITKPSVTKEELEVVTDVLGSATTYYGSSYERNTNVEVAAAKINGTLLMPGETYSVTAALTPFNGDNGYYPAPSYESGQVVDTYGGGVCQVSSTLYNAVLKAELQVDERHNHTMTVSYLDPSKDAAIAEGLMDFVFTNNKEYPIYIYGAGYQGTLNFTIYGHETRDPGRSISFRSETLSQTDPNKNVTLVAKPDQNIGYLNQTQAAHQGSEAVLWKDIVNADGSTETVQVNSSSYHATPAIYEVGTASVNPQAAAAIQTAIANNDLNTVQAVINGAYGNPNVDPNAVQTEPQTEAPQTEAPQTEAPQTEAPQTEAPQTDAPQTEAPPQETPQTDNIIIDGDVTVIS